VDKLDKLSCDFIFFSARNKGSILQRIDYRQKEFSDNERQILKATHQSFLPVYHK
jgi:hypothetical protein